MPADMEKTRYIQGSRRRFSKTPAIAGAVILIGVAGWGIAARLAADARLAQRTADALIPTVEILTATAGSGLEEVVLPGTVQPLIEAPIYARTSGYVREWFTDIGAPVKKGQILAELDTPEIDQQLRQAEADLGTAQANDTLAQSTAKRWAGLLATDSVSRQDNDEKQADAAAKHALLASAAANVQRLKELEGFKHVSAPFDGVVTARQTDIGALINSGASQGSALFRVADTSKLRIYVQVPETSAPLIKPGIATTLAMASDPAHSVSAQVVRTSDALDPSTRTLMVEIQADNAKHQILPGGYAQVHFHLPIAAGRPRLPVNALIFRHDGMQVAKLESDHAKLVPVTMGRDFGSQVEIAGGIAVGDQVIISPPDSLTDGAQVRVAKPASKELAK